MDWKIELVHIPVSDVDRAKAFYVEQVGFNADHDHRVNDEMRFVQLTPPGSACSIAIGTGLGSDAAPAKVRVGCLDVQDFPWGRFVFFADPDGNTWALQELPPRG